MKNFKQYLTEKTDVNALAQKIAELTNNNDHTGALMLLAKEIGSTRNAKILEHLDAIHDLENFMPQELQKYRDKMQDSLLSYVKAKFSAEEFKLIDGAF